MIFKQKALMLKRENPLYLKKKRKLGKKVQKFFLIKHKSMSWKYGGNLLEGAG